MKHGFVAFLLCFMDQISRTLASMDALVETEAYEMLLFRANERKKHYNFAISRKYTAEHNELVEDIVRTFNGLKSTSGQYEVLKRLMTDLGIVEMTSGSFKQRACAIRKQIGATKRASRQPTVGVEISKILEVLLEGNPEISVKEICKSLVLKLRGMEAPPDLTGLSGDDIRSWLQYRKYHQRYQGLMDSEEKREKNGTSKRQRSCFSEEELFWKEVSLAIADPPDATAEARTNDSLSCCCEQSEIDPHCSETDGRECGKRKIQEIL